MSKLKPGHTGGWHLYTGGGFPITPFIRKIWQRRYVTNLIRIGYGVVVRRIMKHFQKGTETTCLESQAYLLVKIIKAGLKPWGGYRTRECLFWRCMHELK